MCVEGVAEPPGLQLWKAAAVEVWLDVTGALKALGLKTTETFELQPFNPNIVSGGQ